MSPIQRVTLGQGGSEHDAADAAISSFTGRRFADQVAVVTGAGSGIGRAVAVRLAAEGARWPPSTWPRTIWPTTVATVSRRRGHGHRPTRATSPRSRRWPTRWPPSSTSSGPQRGVQRGRHRWLLPHRGHAPRPVGADPGRQPHRAVPGVPGHPAQSARARGVHRQRGLQHRADGAVVLGRLLRLQGRPAHVLQGAGRRVPVAGGAGQRGGPRRRGHPADRGLRAARGGRLQGAEQDHDAPWGSPRRPRSPPRSPSSPRTSPPTPPARCSRSTEG